MARRRSGTEKAEKKDEHLETLSSGEPPEGELSYATESRKKGDATTKKVAETAAEEVPPTPPRAFRVVRGGKILARGYRTKLREGKIIDDLNYDIAQLKQQGILLEEVNPKERVTAGSVLDDF
jgi:hypothetical protein